MLVANTIISAIGMILLPLVAGYFIARKFKLSFKDFRILFTAGAITFIASQVLHIPFLYGLTALFKNGMLPAPPESWSLIFNAVLLGLLAGIFEETARYVLFKFFMKKSHTWEDGISIGLGHGGIEAIFIGVLAISALAQMIAMRGMTDLSSLGIPAGQLEAVQTQVATYWSQPSFMPFFGLMERISAVSLHIGLSVLVLYSIVTGRRKWFLLAILLHAIVDATAAYVYPKITAGTHVLLGTLGLEVFVAVFGIGVLVYAVRLRHNFPVKAEAKVI